MHRVDASKLPAGIYPSYQKRMGDEKASTTSPSVDNMIGKSIVTTIGEDNLERPLSIAETHTDSTEGCCTAALASVCTSLSSSLASASTPTTKRKARFREDELPIIKDDEEDEDSFHTGNEFIDLDERHDCPDDVNESRGAPKDFDASMNLRGLAELSKELSSLAQDSPKPAKPQNAQDGSLPQFEYDQLEMGGLLRRGKFSDVYALTKISSKRRRHRQHQYTNYNDSRSQQDDDAMEDFQAQFAVKLLRPSNVTDPSWFKSGASKFAAECKLLATLDHPNIMKIYAESVTTLADFSAEKASYHFIIEDQLKDTLDKRIHGAWRTTYLDLRKGRTKSLNASFNKIRMFGKRDRKSSEERRMEKKDFLLMRLNVALDIANALAYLHAHNIICRDVKPSNIGFDCFGDVKLFDLGLAKELLPDLRARGKLCKLTGAVGSMRYMAPEMFLGQPYGLLADTYSFSILLWEILSLKKPFANMTPSKHTLLVVKGSERPSIDLSLSFRLRSLMKQGWAKRPKERPKMTSVIKDLEREIQRRSVSGSLSSEGSFASRRSAASFASFASIVSNDSSWLVDEEDMHESSATYDTFMGSSSTSFLDSDAAMAS